MLRNKQGSATVEAAITLPVLVAIIFGYIWCTNIIKDSLVLQTAAREGARASAVYLDSNIGRTKAYAELQKGQVQGAQVTATSYRGGRDRGMVVSKGITLSIPFLPTQNLHLKHEVIIKAQK